MVRAEVSEGDWERGLVHFLFDFSVDCVTLAFVWADVLIAVGALSSGLVVVTQ